MASLIDADGGDDGDDDDDDDGDDDGIVRIRTVQTYC